MSGPLKCRRFGIKRHVRSLPVTTRNDIARIDPPLTFRSIILDRPSIFVISLPQIAPLPYLRRDVVKYSRTYV